MKEASYILSIACFILLLLGGALVAPKFAEQQRQINMICNTMPYAMRESPNKPLPACIFGHLPEGKYTLLFADYSARSAICNFTKGTDSYDVCIYEVPTAVLEHWPWKQSRLFPDTNGVINLGQ